jgi:hypothetical protein
VCLVLWSFDCAGCRGISSLCFRHQRRLTAVIHVYIYREIYCENDRCVS